MSWDRVSLFTNVTRDPAETVINLGEAPLGEGEGEGAGVSDGVVGVELSPPLSACGHGQHERECGDEPQGRTGTEKAVVLIPLRLCVCVARVDN